MIDSTMVDESAGVTHPFRPAYELGSDILAETYHRTANQFALLASYVRLKGKELSAAANPTTDVQLFLEVLEAQIRSVARLHRTLTFQSTTPYVALAVVLQEVCAPFANDLLSDSILVEDFSPDCVVGAEQALLVGQIVVEAITNALKHADPSRSPTVLVRCQNAKLGVLVEVHDDGPGLPPRFDAQTDGGLGFKLMRAHSLALGGELSFHSERSGVRMMLVI